MELLSDVIRFFSIGCLILMIIGFISPSKSLFWYKGEKTKKKSSIIYLISFIALIIISGLILPKDVSERRRIENEQLALKNREEKDRKLQEKKKEEQEKKKEIENNTPILLENINDFKDYPEKYIGKILVSDCSYSEKNGLKLKNLIEVSKKDTIPLYLDLLSSNGTVDMKMDFATSIQAPNITSGYEYLVVTFLFTKGDFFSGNKVISITRK